MRCNLGRLRARSKSLRPVAYRRFAGPVRPDQTRDLTRAHVEVNSTQSLSCGIVGAHIAQRRNVLASAAALNVRHSWTAVLLSVVPARMHYRLAYAPAATCAQSIAHRLVTARVLVNCAGGVCKFQQQVALTHVTTHTLSSNGCTTPTV